MLVPETPALDIPMDTTPLDFCVLCESCVLQNMPGSGQVGRLATLRRLEKLLEMRLIRAAVFLQQKSRLGQGNSAAMGLEGLRW